MKTKILALLSGAVLLVSYAISAQTPAKKYSPPRTGDGRPDLNGTWSNASVTNLQRAPNQKLVVSREEAEKIVKANPLQRLIEADDGPSDLSEDITKDANSDRGYNAFWIDPGNMLAKVKGEYRTSFIVEPATGQMPLSEEGRKRIQSERAARTQALFHGPEALPIPERCLIGFSGAGGPGMLNTMYNNNYQIVQTPQNVVIMVEMVHDARTIPIFKDKASALAAVPPKSIKSWLGVSVGWWEGHTLVTHVSNVHPQQARSGPVFLSEDGYVTERFTRVGPTEIFYEFEVHDPVYYTQSWKAEQSLNARKESIYEYACHEGNYAMEGILRGARNQEAQGIKPTQGPGIFGTPIVEKKKQ
jgi:hypothetical protein